MVSMIMLGVSVIIPLYNKGKYIARALDSVFAQTYQEFEVIVVDDGSTDEGPDIVRTYHDPRLRLIQQANAGPGSARNRGIKETTTPYLAFLDADDEWLPGFLDRAMTNLQEHENCVLCAVGYMYPSGEVESPGIVEGEYRLPLEIDPIAVKKVVDFLGPGRVLYRKEAFWRFACFYENRCTYGEEEPFSLQILLNFEIYRDPTPLMVYHTEASELGIHARKGLCLVRPILTDPEPVRRNCPPEYRDLLERYLAYYALRTYHNHLAAGDTVTCASFLHEFPLMKTWRWEYTKLRIKVFCPPLHRLISRVKALFHNFVQRQL